MHRLEQDQTHQRCANPGILRLRLRTRTVRVRFASNSQLHGRQSQSNQWVRNFVQYLCQL